MDSVDTAEQPERRPRRFGRFEEHGEVISGGLVLPLGDAAELWDVGPGMYWPAKPEESSDA